MLDDTRLSAASAAASSAPRMSKSADATGIAEAAAPPPALSPTRKRTRGEVFWCSWYVT